MKFVLEQGELIICRTGITNNLNVSTGYIYFFLFLKALEITIAKLQITPGLQYLTDPLYILSQ